MNQNLNLYLILLFLVLLSSSLFSQETEFADRKAIITATENFFIGDHTGSIKHKKLSMHEKGAYRYVNKDGEYSKFDFDLDSDDSDNSYKEEILSVEIFETLALVKLRLAELSGGQHYKVLILHKVKDEWKITTIVWGSEITQ